MSRAPDPLRLIIAAAVTIIVLIRVGVWLRQEPPPAPRPSGSGAVAGSVVDAHGHGVTGVRMRLAAARANTSWDATTDGAGRFSFSALPADTFNLTGGLAGYLPSYFSAGDGYGATPIELAEGERLNGAVLRLFPTSSISGVVYDERGKPTQGRYVRALRQRGERTLASSAQLGAIDANGRYTIADLEAGDYLVSLATDPQARHARVFGPGTLRLSHAAPLTVGAGETRTGVDIRVPETPASDLTGTIRRADHGAIDSGEVFIYDARDPRAAPDDPSVRFGPDGRFAFSDVAAGEWLVVATANARPEGRGPTGRPTRFYGEATVTTDGRHPVTRTIDLGPGRRVAGTVVVTDPTAADVPPAVSVWLGSNDPVSRGVTIGTSGAGGPFELAAARPGHYGVVVDPPYALTALTVDGHPVNDATLAVSAREDLDGIAITVRFCGSAITGVVRGPDGRPAPDSAVVALRKDGPTTERPRVQRPSTHGTYHLGSLPAGDFFVAVVANIDLDAWRDPAALAAIRAAATLVSVKPGETVTRDLTYARR